MSATLINIALDLETLSTQEDAAILQIGCCIPYFDRKHVPVGVYHEFEVTISYEEALKSKFHKDSQTMEWWDKQNTEARRNVFSGQDTYDDAFHQLKFWVDSIRTGGAEVAIYGNGSDFDNRILSYALDSFGYHNVWSYRNNRDLRTLKALYPLTVPDHPLLEIKHTALGDARYEARLIHETKKFYRLESL